MLDIRWRPSGGRGEYEYKASKHKVLHKKLTVRVPILGTDIPTDLHCEFIDGKPRLRREKPNDRAQLNVPPLVAAIAGLPSPRREDVGTLISPLADGQYVVDSIQFDVVSESATTLTIEPRLLRPRHGEYLDVEERIRQLIASESTLAPVKALLEIIRNGKNIASDLKTAATKAYVSLPISLATGASAGSLAQDDGDDIVESFTGTEGKVRIREHRHRERNRTLVNVAKRRFKRKHGALFCECCGIDFATVYSTLGQDYIEVHHVLPLGKLTEETETDIEDLAMLCSNCHRMVHRTATCSVDEVRTLLSKNNSFVSIQNIQKLKH